MDPKHRIHTKITALQAARDHLLNRAPSEVVAITQLEVMINNLGMRPVLFKGGTLRTLSPREEASLQAAVQLLDNAINTSAGASQTLHAASYLAGLQGDDPTDD
jgi:hypothetical protein